MAIAPAARSNRYLLPALATAAATVLLLAPLLPPGEEESPFGLPHLDKIAHLLLFVVLAHLWRRAFARAGRRSVFDRLALFTALVAYGAGIEILQGWSGTRTLDWWDLAADGLGAAAVLVLGGAVAEAPVEPQPGGRTDVESE